MSEAPSVVYLEADDEVTSVVRRLRAADPGPIVIVAPGRSRATSSVVALRLLGRAAAHDGRTLSVVGDVLTRSLAAEAGLPAFATLDDARTADGGEPLTVEPRHAAISVVRGPAADETAPTLMAASASAPTSASVSGALPDDLTRPVAVPLARRGQVGRHRAPPRMARRSRSLPVAALGIVVVLVLGAVVGAVTVLPAATITIEPRGDDIGPVDYVVAVPDAERLTGTASATVDVIATGSYTVQEASAGSVVLFNWTFFPVDVPAGTFVAAGEQAFATQADVTVPRGQLTGQGTIAAGDIAVVVLAAAPGPGGNVEAEQINVVVNEAIDARLRGFPENSQPRVLNPEATSGGVDSTGPEITQDDVDAALTALEDDLTAQVEDASRADDDGDIVVEVDRGAPVVELPDDLVGTRDQERVEISGELGWEAVRADPATVVELARARVEADRALLAAGHELLLDSVEVELDDATLAGAVLTVPVQVTARSIGRIDIEEVRNRIAGRSAGDAAAAVSEFGGATVELWPGWVGTVPELDWRVEILVTDTTEDGT